MKENTPDPVVSEETGRRAVDVCVGNVVNAQRQAGRIPDVEAAEKFVRPIVERTIKKHEERVANPRAASPMPGQAKDRIGRNDVGGGRQVIARAPDMKARLRRNRPKSREDALLRQRLGVLEKIPEWHDRLVKAAWEGEAAAMRSGSMLDRVSWPRRRAAIGEYMMKVVESSNLVFGDWKNPKSTARLMLSGTGAKMMSAVERPSAPDNAKDHTSGWKPLIVTGGK